MKDLLLSKIDTIPSSQIDSLIDLYLGDWCTKKGYGDSYVKRYHDEYRIYHEVRDFHGNTLHMETFVSLEYPFTVYKSCRIPNVIENIRFDVVNADPEDGMRGFVKKLPDLLDNYDVTSMPPTLFDKLEKLSNYLSSDINREIIYGLLDSTMFVDKPGAKLNSYDIKVNDINITNGTYFKDYYGNNIPAGKYTVVRKKILVLHPIPETTE